MAGGIVGAGILRVGIVEAGILRVGIVDAGPGLGMLDAVCSSLLMLLHCGVVYSALVIIPPIRADDNSALWIVPI